MRTDVEVAFRMADLSIKLGVWLNMLAEELKQGEHGAKLLSQFKDIEVSVDRLNEYVPALHHLLLRVAQADDIT